MRLRHASVAFCAALLLTARPALAGKSGTWTKLGQSNLDNIDEAALARTANGTLLWRVGAPGSVTLDQGKADHIVGLAADAEGRLWVFWILRGSSPTVFARRSNEAATASGPTVAAKAPPGQQSGFKISGNAQSSTLDLVGLFGDTSSQAQWHTQVLPGLAIKPLPSTLKSSKSTKVSFTVSDPDPAKGATVHGAGKSATTDAKGHASITLGPTSKSSIAVTLTKAHYTEGATRVRVKHAGS
ncbi:MAG TPA: hypothetical protein VK501_24595 [Baekduia sp.]|uniref:hypothetical protein n=1 Tax=Baekduia sp. TaxID=2600305 RepID=UPI002B72E67B|nr:hypothetical protein [Baekduia sp.]HMJ37107.1 hypothetical protein [Baekduia sp.]